MFSTSPPRPRGDLMRRPLVVPSKVQERTTTSRTPPTVSLPIDMPWPWRKTQPVTLTSAQAAAGGRARRGWPRWPGPAESLPPGLAGPVDGALPCNRDAGQVGAIHESDGSAGVVGRRAEPVVARLVGALQGCAGLEVQGGPAAQED